MPPKQELINTSENVLHWLIQNGSEGLTSYSLSRPRQAAVHEQNVPLRDSARSPGFPIPRRPYSTRLVEAIVEAAPDMAKKVNEYDPVDETALIINMIEFKTGITGLRNYKGWKTNAAIPHNRNPNGYRDPFTIHQIVLHESAADTGDGFYPKYNHTAHLGVQKNATILQFNDLVERESHTIGLNDTSIGIEFVNRGWLSSKKKEEGIPATEGQLTSRQEELYKEAKGYLWTFWGYGFNIYKLPSSIDQLEKEVELVNWMTSDLQIILNNIRGTSIYNMFPWIDPVWLQLVSYDEVKDIWKFKDANIPVEAERTQKNLFVMTTGYDYLLPNHVRGRSGVISHNATYDDHSDGSFLALYSWLRLEKGKDKNKAFDLCKSLMKQHWFRVTPKSDSGKRVIILDVREINLV